MITKNEIEDQKQLVSKIDYQSSAKHSLFGRFMLSSVDSPSPFEFMPDIPMNADNSSAARSYAFTAGSTYCEGS